MTVIISLLQPNWVVMCADSRRTQRLMQLDPITFVPLADKQYEYEYSNFTKIYPIPGLGCLSIWGDLTYIENSIKDFVDEVIATKTDILELRYAVEGYLRNIVRPHEDDVEVGFHVGGFTRTHDAKLWHIFYGRNRPSIEGELPDYRVDEFPTGTVLYNGRNEFVHPIVQLLNRFQTETGTRIFVPHPIQQVLMADFLTRIISEQIPDVGGAIKTVLISRDNLMFEVTNSNASRLDGEIDRLIKELESFMRSRSVG